METTWRQVSGGGRGRSGGRSTSAGPWGSGVHTRTRIVWGSGASSSGAGSWPRPFRGAPWSAWGPPGGLPRAAVAAGASAAGAGAAGAAAGGAGAAAGGAGAAAGAAGAVAGAEGAEALSLPDPSDLGPASQELISQKKFEEIKKANQAAAKKLVEGHSSSSEEEGDEDIEGKQGKIVDRTFITYASQIDGDMHELERTRQYINEAFQSGAMTCLICIASVKRNQAVWSCSGCFCIFHMPCIQKWAKDSLFLVSSPLMDDDFEKRDCPWPCPKCRFEYKRSDTPTRYYCYCGKVEDPPLDPWLVPHSCGQVCERVFKPPCGHRCLLLCHPGPCPPCPKTVTISCYCKKAKPVSRRCSAKEWSCQQPCGRELQCGQHKCENLCHEGDCQPCPRISKQKCACGKQVAERLCASPVWHCDQVCGKILPCGHHKCEQVCHPLGCGECPRSGKRFCPCQKSKFFLPCTEDVPTCGDNCDKVLECGIHRCSQRCHRGPCEICRQEVEKQCRCGKHTKRMPCHKPYHCETKCPKMRDCQRHQCRRKCCPGNCPPCDLPCARALGCRNHKCPSICHRDAQYFSCECQFPILACHSCCKDAADLTKCHKSSCYPCPEIIAVKCKCGNTRVTVPCGRERTTKPPRCKELCSQPSTCHHPNREKHRCHFGPCPPCHQPCLKVLEKCGHLCQASCHDQALIKQIGTHQPAGPWEQIYEPVYIQTALPCPPCQVPIPTECLGKHEVSPLPCHAVGPYSCKRFCGRRLNCQNHKCKKECHKVTGIRGCVDKKKAGPECLQCEEACCKPRPPDCPHQCILLCHPGACPPCVHMLRLKCHCKLISLYVECRLWSAADVDEKNVLSSCRNQCPKELPCGHRCKELCHPGECPFNCNQKVKLRCPCKRIKKDLQCTKVREGRASVECDTICKEIKRKAFEIKEAEAKAVVEEEKRKQQAELEAFENRLKGRRKKNRKRNEVVIEPSAWQKYKKVILFLVCTIVVMFAWYVAL